MFARLSNGLSVCLCIKPPGDASIVQCICMYMHMYAYICMFICMYMLCVCVCIRMSIYVCV